MADLKHIGITVTGFSKLSLVAAAAGPEVKKDLDARFRDLAEPIRASAESLAAARIRRIGVPWSRMRVGVTRRVVYVAPKKRGSRGRGAKHRPNLATLLEQRAMTPALDAHKANLEHGAEEVLTSFALRWNRI